MSDHTDKGTELVIAELLTWKQAALLTGSRDSLALILPALPDLIVRIGQIMIDNHSVRVNDLNAVILHRVGEGAVALDVLMLIE